MDVSYGALGQLVAGLARGCKETMVSQEDPVAPDDLFELAKKMDINDESCVWVEDDDTITQTAQKHRGDFVRTYRNDNTASVLSS
jgi:DNA-directed RNA polymerase subunit H (RpoH/RPB5)